VREHGWRVPIHPVLVPSARTLIKPCRTLASEQQGLMRCGASDSSCLDLFRIMVGLPFGCRRCGVAEICTMWSRMDVFFVACCSSSRSLCCTATCSWKYAAFWLHGNSYPALLPAQVRCALVPATSAGQVAGQGSNSCVRGPCVLLTNLCE
jgi:hypothetical protein